MSMKYRVAVFQHSRFKWFNVFERGDADEGDDYTPAEEYARVSEWQDIEFEPLSLDVVVQSQLNALDREEQTIRTRFQVELDRVANAKAELLSLPAPTMPTTTVNEIPF